MPDWEQIARFTSNEITQEEMKVLWSNKRNEITKLKEELHDLRINYDTIDKEIEENRDEFDRVKEENEKLKKDLEFQTKKHDYYYCKYEELGTMIEDAKDKQVIIKELKKEIEKHREKFGIALGRWCGDCQDSSDFCPCCYEDLPDYLKDPEGESE